MDLNYLFQDLENGHSNLQMDYFITNKNGITEYGKYKQALRELYKRWRGLKETYFQLELMQVDLEELENNLSKDKGKFENKRNEINKKKKEFDILEIKKTIETTEREFKRFYGQCVALKEKLGSIDEHKKELLEKEFWKEKLTMQMGIEYLANGRLSQNLLEIVMLNDDELKSHLLNNIYDQKALIDNIETKTNEVNLSDKKILIEGGNIVS